MLSISSKFDLFDLTSSRPRRVRQRKGLKTGLNKKHRNCESERPAAQTSTECHNAVRLLASFSAFCNSCSHSVFFCEPKRAWCGLVDFAEVQRQASQAAFQCPPGRDPEGNNRTRTAQSFSRTAQSSQHVARFH